MPLNAGWTEALAHGIVMEEAPLGTNTLQEERPGIQWYTRGARVGLAETPAVVHLADNLYGQLLLSHLWDRFSWPSY
jgi:hypothetical protein